jgi:DNA-binding beta-propeller fold protein YncE
MATIGFKRIALWILATLALAGAVIAGVLIYPGTPSPAKSLKFEGYATLPDGRWLTILDYISVDGRSLFVTSPTGGQVYKLALDAPFSDVAVIKGPPATHGVAVDPVSGLAFVTRSEANTVDVFDPKTMKIVKRIAVADDDDAIFYDPADKILYVDSGGSKVATLIDPTRQASIGTIALGGSPEFAAFDPQTKLFYQNLKDTNAVAAVDVTNRSVIGRWPLEGCQAPTGMAIDTAQRRLFVACSGNAKLVIFNLDGHRVTGQAPVGGGPDSVAYDPVLHRIYVTGRSGVMSVIAQDSPDSYRQLDQLHLHYGAHTLAVDPVTHRVFAGYASLLLPARLAVFSPVA